MTLYFTRILILAIAMSTSLQVFATEIKEVLPITSTILLVHFDDGYARHHRRGEVRTNEWVVVDALDVTKAMLKGSYILSSSDDANYSSGISPADIGRKSKPTEFALMCQTYNNGCVNSDPDHALEHWVYLFLPKSLISGKHYSLHLDNLATGSNSVDFVFDEVELRSEAIHVNNLGYSTKAPHKYAYLSHWLGDKGSLDLSAFNNKPFKVYDVVNHAAAFTGVITFRKSKSTAETGQASETPSANFSSADTYECDFSAFNTPGEYKIVVDGIGSSFTFSIGEDVYREAFYWTMKGLYQNRSGIALTAPYTDMPRPAPHHIKLTPGFSGKLKYSTFRAFDMSSYDGAEADRSKIEAGYKGTLDETFGWYQDAGDWDGYYTHTHVPGYLLFLYESGKSKFSDGELNIPESGNGIPDLLDEASWLMRYFKRAKDEIVKKGWGTGGVPGARVFGDLWGSDAPNDIGQGSWQDVQRDWYVLGEDVWTTYKYAALAAQLAFILEDNSFVDPDGVDWRKEAIAAYSWANQKSTPADEAPRQDYVLQDMRLYAAASLYRLTGDDVYHVVAQREIKKITGSLDAGKQDQLFGVWMYLLSSDRVREEGSLVKCQTLVTSSAERYLNTSSSRNCRWGGDFYFPMLVGQGSTPMIAPGVYGYLLNQKNPVLGQNYLSALYTTADYFLGCNPLNMTWISGVGERYPVGLFHLDYWYRDKDDPNNVLPVQKGIVPYGPWRHDDLGALGWWNPNFAYSDVAGNPRIYPTSVDVWPGHERWFDMRVSPLSSEFTIHQNTVIAAFVYGFLSKGDATVLEEGTVTANEGMSNENSQVTVFPNPATDSIEIQLQQSEHIHCIRLLGTNGELIREVTNRGKSNHVTLDVRSFRNGAYVIEVTTSGAKRLTTKIFIAH